jgi:hypothetical protein
MNTDPQPSARVPVSYSKERKIFIKKSCYVCGPPIQSHSTGIQIPVLVPGYITASGKGRKEGGWEIKKVGGE